MESLDIGPALEEDLPAIVALAADLSREIDGPDAVPCEVVERNVRALFQDPGSHFLVARCAGAVVGFANFALRRTLIHSSASGLIDEFVVAKSYRGQGIGTRLLAGVVEQCRQLGCGEVEVSALRRNQPARRFYRKCGFAEEAVLLEMDLEG